MITFVGSLSFCLLFNIGFWLNATMYVWNHFFLVWISILYQLYYQIFCIYELIFAVYLYVFLLTIKGTSLTHFQLYANFMLDLNYYYWFLGTLYVSWKCMLWKLSFTCLFFTWQLTCNQHIVTLMEFKYCILFMLV